MATKLFLLLFPLFFIPTVMPSPPPSASSSGEKSIELIQKYCKHTIYPQFCYTSLAKYANAIHPTPIQLLQLASNLTVHRLRGLSNRVSLHARAAADQDATALLDCEKALREAVDKARQSTRELAGMKAEGLEVGAQVAKVQSWMGMALTNMDTCYDNLDKVSSHQVKADMRHRLQQIKRFTSNALSLVDSFVADIH